ncbi:MAG: PAS domain-containing protein [Telluria sp.]
MSFPGVNINEAKAVEQLRVFGEAARLLASSLDLDQTLANTIDACLPALGDFGFFDVVLDADTVRRTVRAHNDEDAVTILKPTQWIRSERTDMNLCALSTGASAFHTDIDDAWYLRAAVHEGQLAGMRALAFQSMISVPLIFGGELLGALTLFMAKSARRHDQADLAFAEQVAVLAAPIVFNVRLLDRQRRSEAALAKSEWRLRVATDAGRIGIWEWHLARDRVEWSDRVYDLHGLRRGEFGGTSAAFSELVHPDDRAPLWQRLEEAKQDRSTFDTEFRTLLPNGEVRWLSTWAGFHGEGADLSLIGATIDINDQKDVQHHLEVLNAQLAERAQTSESSRERLWRLSQDVQAIAKFDGYRVAVNPAFTRVLGWSEEEACRLSMDDFVHPSQRAEMRGFLEQLRAGQALARFDLRVRHKEGTYRWMSWTAVSEGEHIYYSGHDVTEVKRLRELQRSSSEVRLQLAMQVGGTGAWEWDMRAGTIRWWAGMHRMHGVADDFELPSMQAYMDLVHPDDRASLMHRIEHAMARGEGHRFEYRIVWPDGSVHWVDSLAEFAFDENGEIMGMAGVCVDCTNRKRTEHQLRFVADVARVLSNITDDEGALRELARLAVPAFADWCAVDLLGPEGDLRRVALVHADPSRLELGWRIAQTHPAGPTQQGGAWDVLRTGEAQFWPRITREMLEQQEADPERRAMLSELGVCSYIGVPLPARGTVLGVLTFVSADSHREYDAEDVRLAEDIGRRAGIALDNAALYRSLKAADKRKDEFLAMLAHELRNPLAPIRAAAELMKVTREAGVVERSTAVIARQVDHMTGLVDDLLDVSRVTRGLVALERRPVRLDTVAASALEQVRPLAEAKGHRVSLVLSPEPLLVEGDEKRLTQVIANLLNNAAKYTPAGGDIGLVIAGDAQHVSVEVRDNGIGMEPALVETVFELFAQAERSADRSQGGLGIGLALVRSLVELHGGRVKAQSAGPGQGSTFSVRLPRLEARTGEPGQAAAGAGLPVPARALDILVVDDNFDAADILGMFLGAAGHRVRVCHSSREALALAAAQAFDVCVLDIGLPEIDGYELARRLRALRSPAPRMIAVTGYGQERDRSNAASAGFDHYLVKPVNMTDLVAILSRP